MSFFSKLFGSKKEPKINAPRPQQQKPAAVEKGKPFFTNAPEHWGVITDEFLATNKNFTENYDNKKGETIVDKRMFMVNSLVLLGAINSNLAEKAGRKILSSYSEGFLDSKEQYATSCAVHKLFDEGVIMTNGVVIDNFEKYAVFLFTTPISVSYINTLKKKFLDDGFKDLIYYSVAEPEISEAASVELPYTGLQKEDFTMKSDQSREQRKHKEYALWWTDRPGVTFSDTRTFKILTDYYENAYDCNTYLLGKLGYALGLNQDDQRVRLPEYDEVVITGPEDVEIIITISEKTGINFHFPLGPAFEKYRDNFLSGFGELARSIKEQVVESNFERDTNASKPAWIEQARNENNIESISLILSDKMLKYLN